MLNMRLNGVLILVCGSASAALADPPVGYYNSITGTDGATLSTQLGSLLNNAITRSYGDARDWLQDIEEDPNNPNNIILVYNDASVVSTWDSGATWNREHTWPRSLGVGDNGSDYSDLHQLHPCNPSINSSRGNKQFGSLPGQWDPNLFGGDYRGRMARMAFYMKTRYTYLNIPTLGSQSLFIDWHVQNMPGDIENLRNDEVYIAQQNRNAFADRPEWVWAIFGTGPSDAQIVIAGETPSAGATTQTIDLGTVIGDISSLPPVSVDLDKTGSAPTTYSVVTTGDLLPVSSYQFGLERNSRSTSHQVALTGAGFGPYSGTVTINNTEVTSAAAGQGSADGDDVVTILANSVGHSLASFDSGSEVTTLAIDFGTVLAGSDPAPMNFDIHNIAPAGVSADLDIDSVFMTGSSGSFTTDLIATPAIAAGSNANFMVDVLAATPGLWQATAFIDVSDENLPGEGVGSLLVLTFEVEIVSECLADVNHDGSVTASDFTAWINAFNNSLPECDQNGDGSCTPTDFTAWITNFNAGC
jgi:endonuclease I